MTETFTLDTTVSYWNADRDQILQLRGLFAYLQEAAIKHADRYGSGARAKQTRGESWVLHRMAVTIHRYPRYEDPLRVVTWSSGIRVFKGYRDFRMMQGEELVASASSIWLYFNIAAKAISRVPREVAARFPSVPEEVHCPDLEKLPLDPPGPEAGACEVSVRYSDIDGNEHVNNTAYFDYLQTALAAKGFPPRPRALQIQFLKAIAPNEERVKVALEPRGQAVAFGLTGAAGLCAHGLLC